MSWPGGTVAFGGLALVLMASACGGRTSGGDWDAEGGRGGQGTAGQGAQAGLGATGLDPRASRAACEAYCKGYRATCERELSSGDCLSRCASEVNVTSQACQRAGIAALECYAPYLLPEPGLTCSEAQKNGEATCLDELRAFEACSAMSPSGGPVPSAPVPTPTPTPPPPDPNWAGNCTGLGGSLGGRDCYAFLECSDGSYASVCIDSGGGTFACSCQAPSGRSYTYPSDGTDTACERTVERCRAAERSRGIPR